MNDKIISLPVYKKIQRKAKAPNNILVFSDHSKKRKIDIARKRVHEMAKNLTW